MPIERWDDVPSTVHSEPWLFRALRELKEIVTGQGEAIAEIRGKVDTLASFVPRPKSPSGDVTKTLLAERLKAGADWRRWGLRISAGVIVGGFGALLHWWLG